MTMSGRGKAPHHARAFRMMRRVARRGASLTTPHFDFAHDTASRLDQSRGGKRPHGERRRRRVAADAAHIRRGGNLGTMHFGKPVDKSLEPDRAGVRLPVPTRVIVAPAQPEVGTEIDDAIGQGRKLVDARHRAAVRQTKKQHVHALEHLSTHELDRRPSPQIGVREMYELAIEALARHLRDRHLRMAEQETKDLAACVSGAADDSGRKPIAHPGC